MINSCSTNCSMSDLVKKKNNPPPTQKKIKFRRYGHKIGRPTKKRSILAKTRAVDLLHVAQIYFSSQKPSSVCHIHCLVHRCFKHETVSYLHFFSKVNSNILNASILFVAVLFSKNSQQILILN